MIVLGADTHKRSHALAAGDAASGALVGQRSIVADEPGHLQALRWARALDDERVWAIEDCRHVSRRLELALVAAGERVIRVAPELMGQPRQGERRPGKSDQIDALAVARAVVREVSSASPRPISTRPRWRSDCCAITARTSSPNAPASPIACAGSLSHSARNWKRRSRGAAWITMSGWSEWRAS